MPKYSVEVREATSGGNDYTENHIDFDTKEEVREFIKHDMYEDEHVHSVLEYADGETNNPRDITREFTREFRSR